MPRFENVAPAVAKSMRANRGKDTKPEMIVRRALHAMGYRYRLHRPDLPGRPDIVFAARRKVIFVHGCFWHQHPDTFCKIARMPKSRIGFWAPKLTANRARDEAAQKALENAGWTVLVLWECGLKDMRSTCEVLRSFLSAEVGDEGD